MRGKIIVLTAPSGSGKTTLANKLLAEFSQIRFSVSATTRLSRSDEIHGENYYFISQEDFEQKVVNSEFLEHETFYSGTRYGTLRSDVENHLNNGYFILLDIEVNGASNIKSMYGPECLSIFVRPPSFQILEERLRSRNTESEESLKLRLQRARMELERESDFDAVVVNDTLEKAYEDLLQHVKPFLES